MNQIVRLSALILLLLYSTSSLAFQDPEMRVGVSAEEIFAGESIDYDVEIRNSEKPSPPDMSAIKELFDVAPQGDDSLNQFSTTIINGRVSQSVSYGHVYHYRLTPKQAGDLQIPAPIASIDGKNVTGRKLSLRVITPERQDLVVVEMTANQVKVYPTQPFTVTLKILVHPLPDNSSIDPLRPLRNEPPHIELNWVETPVGLLTGDTREWLQPLVSRRAGGFTLNNIGSGFFGETAVFDLSNGRETRDDLNGHSVRYFKYELSRTFTGEKYGKYAFGPAVIKGSFVSSFERDRYLARKIVATTPMVEVEVSDVPLPRPVNFCGGIGEFSAAAKVSTTKLRVGDPLTLTLQVRRKAEAGSLELISAPDLSLVEPLVADFELIDKDPTGRVNEQTKEFAYVMRPKRAEVNIPALVLTTFDPVTEAFKEISTLPIELEVSGSVGLNSGEIVGAISPNSTSLKSRSEGIFQNITDPSSLRDERVRWAVWGQLVAGVWIVSGATCAVVLLQRRKSSDPVLQRRQRAKRTANRRIAEARSALNRGEAQQALRDARSAVLGLVADSCNQVCEGLTTADVEQVLAAAKVADGERLAIRELLEAIDASEYGAGLSKAPASMIEDASRWIARVAPLLERRS